MLVIGTIKPMTRTVHVLSSKFSIDLIAKNKFSFYDFPYDNNLVMKNDVVFGSRLFDEPSKPNNIYNNFAQSSTSNQFIKQIITNWTFVYNSNAKINRYFEQSVVDAKKKLTKELKNTNQSYNIINSVINYKLIYEKGNNAYLERVDYTNYVPKNGDASTEFSSTLSGTEKTFLYKNIEGSIFYGKVNKTLGHTVINKMNLTLEYDKNLQNRVFRYVTREIEPYIISTSYDNEYSNKIYLIKNSVRACLLSLKKQRKKAQNHDLFPTHKEYNKHAQREARYINSNNLAIKKLFVQNGITAFYKDTLNSLTANNSIRFRINKFPTSRVWSGNFTNIHYGIRNIKASMFFLSRALERVYYLHYVPENGDVSTPFFGTLSGIEYTLLNYSYYTDLHRSMQKISPISVLVCGENKLAKTNSVFSIVPSSKSYYENIYKNYKRINNSSILIVAVHTDKIINQLFGSEIRSKAYYAKVYSGKKNASSINVLDFETETSNNSHYTKILSAKRHREYTTNHSTRQIYDNINTAVLFTMRVLNESFCASMHYKLQKIKNKDILEYQVSNYTETSPMLKQKVLNSSYYAEIYAKLSDKYKTSYVIRQIVDNLRTVPLFVAQLLSEDFYTNGDIRNIEDKSIIVYGEGNTIEVNTSFKRDILDRSCHRWTYSKIQSKYRKNHLTQQIYGNTKAGLLYTREVLSKAYGISTYVNPKNSCKANSLAHKINNATEDKIFYWAEILKRTYYDVIYKTNQDISRNKVLIQQAHSSIKNNCLIMERHLRKTYYESIYNNAQNIDGINVSARKVGSIIKANSMHAAYLLNKAYYADYIDIYEDLQGIKESNYLSISTMYKPSKLYINGLGNAVTTNKMFPTEILTHVEYTNIYAKQQNIKEINLLARKTNNTVKKSLYSMKALSSSYYVRVYVNPQNQSKLNDTIQQAYKTMNTMYKADLYNNFKKVFVQASNAIVKREKNFHSMPSTEKNNQLFFMETLFRSYYKKLFDISAMSTNNVNHATDRIDMVQKTYSVGFRSWKFYNHIQKEDNYNRFYTIKPALCNLTSIVKKHAISPKFNSSRNKSYKFYDNNRQQAGLLHSKLLINKQPRMCLLSSLCVEKQRCFYATFRRFFRDSKHVLAEEKYMLNAVGLLQAKKLEIMNKYRYLTLQHIYKICKKIDISKSVSMWNERYSMPKELSVGDAIYKKELIYKREKESVATTEIQDLQKEIKSIDKSKDISSIKTSDAIEAKVIDEIANIENRINEISRVINSNILYEKLYEKIERRLWSERRRKGL